MDEQTERWLQDVLGEAHGFLTSVPDREQVANERTKAIIDAIREASRAQIEALREVTKALQDLRR